MPRSSQAVLSQRQLNRALLARQMLLKREKISTVAAVERLVGMQAQVPRPPFMGLWTRIEKFEAEALLKPLRDRKVVRATAMRGTIHLMSTADYLAFRPVLAEMLVKGASAIVGKKMANVDLDRVYTTGREFFGNQHATFDDFRKHIEDAHPEWDVRGMAYTVRMGVPLVMVPTDVSWGFPGNAGFTLAEKWLGKKIPTEATPLEEMVLRYLAAFGPATPSDFQTWSAIRGVRPAFEQLRPKLVTFADDRKRELFDLPKAPRPDEDTPAPVRFLAEYDNALLAHDDRTRIVADEHRAGVFLKNLQVVGTFLVDGYVAGTWKVERKKKDAVLALTQFVTIPKRVVGALKEEGESLLAFLEEDATGRSVRLSE